MASELGHATNGHQRCPTQKPPKLVVASYSIGIRRAPLLLFGSIWGGHHWDHRWDATVCYPVLRRTCCSLGQGIVAIGVASFEVNVQHPRFCGDLLRLIEFLQRQRSRMAFAPQPFDIPLILLVALHPRALLDLRSAGLGSFRGQGGET